MVRYWALIASLLLAPLTGEGRAQGPAQSLSQMRHTGWSLKDGAPGNIRALAQGKDGFLWLGSSTGLYRFDGIRFDRILPDRDDPRRSLQVTALLAARNGDIWVGYDFGGIAVYRDGRLHDANPWPPQGGVSAIVQARDGSVWVAADARGKILLSRYAHGRWSRYGAQQGLIDGMMGPLLATSDGSLYVALPPHLLRLAPNASRFVKLNEQVASYAALAEDDAHRLWLADDKGLRALVPNSPRIRLPAVSTPYITRHVTIDRYGHIWITGQNEGLGYLPKALPRLEIAGKAAGLIDGLSLSALEDREGNIWVGTEAGLDRFAKANLIQAGDDTVVTGFVKPPRSARFFYAGTAGVYRVAADARPKLIFRKSDVGVLCGNERRLLAISLSGAFLLDLTEKGEVGRQTAVEGPLSVSCAVDAKGQFWAGMDRLYRLEGNHLLPTAGPAGQPGGTITLLRAAGDGGLIAARSRQGLFRIDGATETLLLPRATSLIGSVNTLLQDGGHLLVGGQKGLTYLGGGKTQTLTERIYPFLAGITGIHRTRDGWTWLNGATGIVRIRNAALEAGFAHPGRPIPYERIGHEGNYRARSNLFDANDMVEDDKGRLWFATNQGLAWTAAYRLTQNSMAPPVVIKAVHVDAVRYAIGNGQIMLPAHSQRVQIDYSALSLTDAEENRFRYHLSGAGAGWFDAGTERQALFTNLAPGRYAFRVIAANNDGIWNKEGQLLSFEIAPAFYQTRWFLAFCLAILLGASWLLYRWRLQVVAERARGRVEAQLLERERIARELHDTLLQGFQGLMLRFQAVVELLPRGQRARAELETTLDRAEEVLIESRERVHTLRQDLEPVVLAERLDALLRDLIGERLHWTIEELGVVRLVCGPVADEAAWIVREAVSNSLRHASASTILLRISHGTERLSVAVVDDGSGLPSPVIETGMREGHYGMVGMRERACRLTGTLEISSVARQGTEIRLIIPARVAYQ
ncbi:sensor histidine kinase [Sphingobium sp. YR768]|uniref:sensor histidine kinase n=1 Tax=Sphingobium sp. YR768 TaxID=1884365 RepID=UPI0008B99FC8|nr:two-component regulator propeller domain-containing protein [Sphingobium sp. YR768]SEQ51099.1 Signal transduction histidine kinase [Sphingobium sp. YR768]